MKDNWEWSCLHESVTALENVNLLPSPILRPKHNNNNNDNNNNKCPLFGYITEFPVRAC
jgi:hypothetical protein